MIKSYAGIAAGVASLGAGIVSFTSSFTQLEKKQYDVDNATLTLQRSQASLERMQKSGKATADDLARAQEDVRLKTVDLNLKQKELSDTTMNFYAQMPAQLVSFGTSAVAAFSTYTGGASVATAATTALRTAMTFLMAHPVIFAFAGLATVIGLVATNTFGLRDRFFELGKVVYDFLFKYFRPLADTMKWFYDNILRPLTGAFSTEAPLAIDATTAAFERQTVAALKTGEAIEKVTKSYTDYYAAFNQTDLANFRMSGGKGGTKSVGIFDANFLEKYKQELAKEGKTLPAGFEASQQFSFSSPGVIHGTPASSETLKRQARRQKQLGEAFLNASGSDLDPYDRAAIMSRALPARIDIHLDVDGKTLAIATVEDLFRLLESKSVRNKQVRGRSTLA